MKKERRGGARKGTGPKTIKKPYSRMVNFSEEANAIIQAIPRGRKSKYISDAIVYFHAKHKD